MSGAGDPIGVLPNSSSTGIGVQQPNLINQVQPLSTGSEQFGVQPPNFVDPAAGQYTPDVMLEEEEEDNKMGLFSLLSGLGKDRGSTVVAGGGGGGGSGGNALIDGLKMGQTLATAFAACDRRVKKNIKYISTTKSGVNVYRFEYKDKSHGEGTWVGPMAQEVPYATIEHDGYLWVDRNKLPDDVPLNRYYG